MSKLPYAAALAALALAGPALAHHSFAMFDPSRTITVTGVVKAFQYTNPHSWLIVTGAGPDGKDEEWSFESEGPSTLLRNGIKRSMFMPGDKVTVEAMPMRDGRPAGSLISATRANGELVHFRQGPPQGVGSGN